MNLGSTNALKKIVVSGLGLVTPIGNGREKTWAALLSGQTGIRIGTDGLGAPVLDFSLNGARSRMGDFALLAAEEALIHAGFNPQNLSPFSIGCAVSQSKPIIGAVTPAFAGETTLDASLLLASFFGWSAEEVVRDKFKLNGPCANVVAACATGVASINLGASWIQEGLCDIALVGASESSLNPVYRSGFSQMGVLAEGNPQSVRPFDRERSGFAIGEGSAVLVLESESSVRARGHRPLVALGRSVLHHSAKDAIRFDDDGSYVARLLSAVSGKSQPDYINAHGTATVMNDLIESRGIKLAFKEKAQSIKVSSTKAATGHLLGAAGAIEAAFAILALRDQVAPPTLNLEHPDPECDLDYVPARAVPHSISQAVSLSYGFGGQMGAVSFERIHG